MKDYVSKIVKVPRNAGMIYPMFADLRQLASIIPRDKIEDFAATEDDCSFTVKPLGKTGLRIVNREQDKVVKYAPNGGLPDGTFMWIQFKSTAPYETYIRITLRAELNFVMRNLVGGKIQKGLDNFAEQLEKAFAV